MEESGLENGSVFLKQLDNLFGLGPLPKRCGNDGQPGRGEEGGAERGSQMESKRGGRAEGVSRRRGGVRGRGDWGELEA